MRLLIIISLTIGLSCIFASFSIIKDFSLKYFQWLEEHIRDDKIVAVGEIGLDYHYDDTDKEKQKMVFRKQLEIAERYHIPVIVHSRDSIQDTYNILSNL